MVWKVLEGREKNHSKLDLSGPYSWKKINLPCIKNVKIWNGLFFVLIILDEIRQGYFNFLVILIFCRLSRSIHRWLHATITGPRSINFITNQILLLVNTYYNFILENVFYYLLSILADLEKAISLSGGTGKVAANAFCQRGMLYRKVL